MPCYRCGARQVDPVGGESPWRRGVRGDRLVLICPGCQAAFDWAGDLDHCQVCASVHLVRRLGEAECRDCGAVGQPAEYLGGGQADSDGRGVTTEVPAGLADEVEQALARVLAPSRGRPPYAMS